jgi:hypothetical protein
VAGFAIVISKIHQEIFRVFPPISKVPGVDQADGFQLG